MTRKKKILFGLAAVLVSLGALEIGLRVAGNLYLKRLYVNHTTRFKTSPDACTVIALGESSTAGLWVEKSSSYPRQLLRLLRKKHPGIDINVVVPPHVGQNTSQMANRIDDYMRVFSPRVIILMVGANNHWSWAESHIGRFLDPTGFDRMRARARIWLNEFRLYKVLHYGYLRLTLPVRDGIMPSDLTDVSGGHPDSTRGLRRSAAEARLIDDPA